MTTHDKRRVLPSLCLAALVFAASAAAQQAADNNTRPDTPGTGRFPAIKEEVSSLPAHVV
jgi:hypothetical protein